MRITESSQGKIKKWYRNDAKSMEIIEKVHNKLNRKLCVSIKYQLNEKDTRIRRK